MKAKRLALLAIIGVMALLSTSCEWMRWLRLLSLKKQFAEIERFARIEDQKGLKIRLLKPVVFADDVKLLIEGESLRTTNKNQIIWFWNYQKQLATGQSGPADLDLKFSISFENLKLSELRFDEHFLGLMPKALILGLLRSVGQADVDMKRGTMKVKWAGPGPNQKVELPTRSQIIGLLGEPFHTGGTNGARTFLYKYYQEAARFQPLAERLAWASFTFAANGEQVDASEGIIGNVGWTMKRVPGEPGPQITFSLKPLTVEPVALRLPPESTRDFVGRYQAATGTVLSLGRDQDAFVASWIKDNSGGWCEALPESTNSLFALPMGDPRWTLLRNGGGVVTGLVAQLEGKDTPFSKLSEQLPPYPSEVRVGAQAYAACVGRYKASWGGFVFITSDGERLFWQNQGIQAKVPLYPASETNFFFKVVESPLTFIKNDRGEVTRFILHFQGKDSEAVKMKQ